MAPTATTSHQVREPLPLSYYYFFWLFEPALTLAGAFVAMFKPGKYAADLLPPHIERVTRIMGETTRGGMIIGGLGSCFLLFAMLSLSLFPIIKHHVPTPRAQEKVVKGLLIPLAIADCTHITMTLLPLPMSHLSNPSQWTYVLHGNVAITIMLFCVRSSYLLGIGRPTIASSRSPAVPAAVKVPKRVKEMAGIETTGKLRTRTPILGRGGV